MKDSEQLDIVQNAYNHLKVVLNELDTVEADEDSHEEALLPDIQGKLSQGIGFLLNWVNSLEDKLDPENQEKPWDTRQQEEESETDAHYAALWKACTAAEFYFHIRDREIWITPAAYYDEMGCLFDSSVRIGHLLSNRWRETSDSTFEFEGTYDEARHHLLADGFVEKEMTP